ncbi:MAG: hypothetical protein LBQ80_04735 [Clostridium sp.]|jgi:hypothetical protein|nr:hypothetical protein [Clostridium sp.]
MGSRDANPIVGNWKIVSWVYMYEDGKVKTATDGSYAYLGSDGSANMYIYRGDFDSVSCYSADNKYIYFYEKGKWYPEAYYEYKIENGKLYLSVSEFQPFDESAVALFEKAN